MALPSYSTGTVTIAAGGTTVTGSGSIWTGGNAREGDDFIIAGVMARIVDVVSATQLTITPWTGSTAAGAGYVIYQNASRRFDDVQITDNVGQFVQSVNTRGYVIPVLPNESEPDPSWGDDGQTAEKFSTGDKWQKEAGEWVYIGKFAPLAPIEEWDVDTQYHANSFVTRLGSSWVGVRDNLGKAPESNPGDWTKLASGGADATVTVSETTTGAPGSSASVTSGGTPTNRTLGFTIPRGSVVTVGSTTTGAPGSSAAVSNSGTGGDVVLDFDIPTGTAATIEVGGVSTGAAGSAASVVNSGTSGAAILDFSIPQGLRGFQGIKGDTGSGIQPDATGGASEKAVHDDEAKDFVFLQTDVSPFQLWIKASETSGDWAGPNYIGGNLPIGDLGLVTDSVVEIFELGSVA